MDQDALVDDFEAGANLVSALWDSDFPVTVAAWVRDLESERWRLFLASPLVDKLGKHRAYERLVHALEGLDSPLGVDRITLLSADDPSTQNLSGLVWEDAPEIIHVGPTKIGRQPADDVYLYHADALRYERALLTSLQRFVPTFGGVIRRAHEAQGRDSGVDYIVDAGYGPVAIQAKASRRLPDNYLRRLLSHLRLEFPLLVVTPAPVSNLIDEESLALGNPVRIVRWRGPEDDHDLKGALQLMLKKAG